jgi:hypothetical protein
VSVAGVLLATGLVNAAVALYLCTLIPEFLMRFIVWLCIHSVYRIRHQDLSHIPEQEPGLLACREAGARSVFIIAAACRRPVRFLVSERWFRIPILGFVLRAGRAIVLGRAGEGDPSPAILRALEAGDPLCWMGEPEGAGLRALSDRAPIIPITIRADAASTGVELIASPAIRVADASIEGDQRRAVTSRISCQRSAVSHQRSACSFPLSAIGSALVSAGRLTFDRLHMPEQPPQGEVVGDLHASGEHQRPAEE